ncbi:MAG: hypothetical protein Q9216_000509 [Gyalolechia sp. 2 TL-2023]
MAFMIHVQDNYDYGDDLVTDKASLSADVRIEEVYAKPFMELALSNHIAAVDITVLSTPSLINTTHQILWLRFAQYTLVACYAATQFLGYHPSTNSQDGKALPRLVNHIKLNHHLISPKRQHAPPDHRIHLLLEAASQG